MHNTLYIIALIATLYFAGFLWVMGDYMTGGCGCDLLSQHYRSIL